MDIEVNVRRGKGLRRFPSPSHRFATGPSLSRKRARGLGNKLCWSSDNEK
jgi:hypothetical protein